ncbi:hypothetical protein ACFYW9_14125 [Streptomyces sp. NPDC002698]|uniref:hypothetical protein n=1 Tax=Streptomyces sp. NPDC002698 TaxID=3364660 RepID=UPI0036AB8665
MLTRSTSGAGSTTRVIHLVWPLAALFVCFFVLGGTTDLATRLLTTIGYACASFIWWRLSVVVSGKLPAAVVKPEVRDLLAIAVVAPVFWAAGQLIVMAILLAVVAVPVYIWFKIRSAGKRTGTTPEPGDVWWAAVSFMEDAGTVKDRPVIIKSVHPDAVAAFYLTSQNKDSGTGFTRLACASTWDPAGRQSWAQHSETRAIPLTNLRRFGAALPAGEFQRLCKKHAEAVGTGVNRA